MKSFFDRWPVLLCAAVALCLVLTPAVSRAFRYRQAERQFLNGSYAQAGQDFAGLGSYRDAAEKAAECGYRLAQGLFHTGAYAAAQDLYESLGDYRAAPLRTAACAYLAAWTGGGTGPETVKRLADSLDTEQSREDLAPVEAYLLASAALARGETRQAIRSFQELGAFEDSPSRIGDCRAAAYDLALTCMHTRRFEEALAYFEDAARPEESADHEKYCRLRLAREENAVPEGIVTGERLIGTFGQSSLYYCPPAYIYVPGRLDAETRFLVYFAGGTGEPMLYMDSMYEYLWTYEPESVLLFWESSGVTDIPGTCAQAIAVAEQTAAECGICIHDLVLAGSSNGCYTALHAAAAFYSQDCLAARAVLTLDTGADWASPINLSSGERLTTARAGTDFYLFEQAADGLNIEAIYDLAASGNRVTAVYCANEDHNEMTRLAFSKGVFSWALEEGPPLDPDQYTLVPLTVGE